MSKLKNNIFPTFVLLTTIFPMLFVVIYYLVTKPLFSGFSVRYLLHAFLNSLQYSLLAYFICFLIVIVVLINLKNISIRFLNTLILFFVFQLQIGVIPKLYGYLGVYSVSGFWGVFSETSIFSYSAIGVSISLFYIYAPFFFIPFLSGLRSHTAFSKTLILHDTSNFYNLILLFKIYRKEIAYSSILFFALTLMDFTCSDLIGGGKYDAYGKALYKTVIIFREYLPAFLFGIGLLLILFLGLRIFTNEK